MTEHEEPQVPGIDDELRGALLSADQSIDSAGGNAAIISLLFGMVLAVGLHVNWLDRMFGADLSDFRHWYVYIIIVVAAFLVGAMFCDPLEKSAYRKHRKDIIHLAHRASLGKYQIVASIEEDEDLKHVAEWLKKDTSTDLWKNHGNL